MKLQPMFDDSLEEKAVRFLKSLSTRARYSADAFLDSLASSSDHSLTNFVQSIVVLISSPSRVLKTAAMQILETLFWNSSAKSRLTLVSANLIPQLFTSLNLLSLSFANAFDIHTCLFSIIIHSFWLATPDGRRRLAIEDDNQQQAVCETVLKRVLAPSEHYIRRLCVLRFSIFDGVQSENILALLARLLQICAFYQPTLAFVLHMPVVLAIPSCLTFFEHDRSIWGFLHHMVDAQQEWNKKGGEVRQMWNQVYRMLRMEGIEDMIEEKLQNDRKEFNGDRLVANSIEWNNLLGMNLSKQE
ncbi:hypothetical protein BLNAU_19152 [Blattamonas nauphoetae]|uniref:Uncharacterized protein n=1 Tax=Blattamonas nauphoetae TaxID=2049346 RepID=A0ABQ9X2D2_9EUKA|nr:hypothetical protein BLNAU_19152 [Blattamonas nauphoetae]